MSTVIEIRTAVDKAVASRIDEVIGLVMNRIERSVIKGHIHVHNCSYSFALSRYTQFKIKMHRLLKCEKEYVCATHRWSSFGKRYMELDRDIGHWKKIKDSLKRQG